MALLRAADAFWMRTAAAPMDPVLEERLTRARTRLRKNPVGREGLVRAIAAVGFFAAAVPLALFVDSQRHPSLWLYPAFAVAYGVASSLGFEVGAGEALPTELVLVPMLFVLPAPIVPLVVAAGLALAATKQMINGSLSVWRALAWPPVFSLFALAPAFVFVVANEPRADARGGVVLCLALAAQFSFDACVGTAIERLANGVPARELVRPLAWTFAIDLLLAPLGYVAAVAARVEQGALLLPAPLVALLALFAHERRRRLDSALELSTAYRGTAFLLGDVVEADDAYTGEHSRQVLDLVLAVADRLGLDPHTRRLTEFTALLHDVGKIRIPAEIIAKPGPLTAEERAIINTHTLEAERLLRPVGGLLAEVGRIVRSCHERWDGNGYPDGLGGEQIPLIARIVCCCDAYNAMTTDRPYRAALTHHAALAELLENRGTQFDPNVVDALFEIVGLPAPALAPKADAVEQRRKAGLLACSRCGHHTLLDEPVQQTNLLCLHCGVVPITASG
jgi:HD-GYP domain-containing protein (c-di-GMP phosphodiesterase class II)